MPAQTVGPFKQFGTFNDSWWNHPAGFPVSKYKPNSNPNQGAASYNAWAQSQQNALTPNTPPAPVTPSPAPVAPAPPPPTPTPPANPFPPALPLNPNAGMTATPGFSSRYTPAMLNQAYENPWFILPDVFSGITQNSPLYQQLRDMGGDPLAIYNILQGSRNQVGGGASDFTNWLANMYGEQGKVGGLRLDPKEMIQTLFGQVGKENSLSQVLNAGDMSTQVRTLFNLGRDASNMTMNPLAARGYQAALAQAGDKYGTAMMNADATQSMSPAQWIAANAPSLALKGA